MEAGFGMARRSIWLQWRVRTKGDTTEGHRRSACPIFAYCQPCPSAAGRFVLLPPPECERWGIRRKKQGIFGRFGGLTGGPKFFLFADSYMMFAILLVTWLAHVAKP